MLYKPVLILLLLPFIASSDEEEEIGFISLKFTVSSKDEHLIAPVTIGEPGQEMNLVLDVSSLRTWVSDKFFDSESSRTFHDLNVTEKFEEHDFAYSGLSARETITIGQRTLHDFGFLLVNKAENVKFNGVLSLGREFDTKHKSWIYEMSHTSNTYYNMFGFNFINENEGELRIGDLSEGQKHNSQNLHKCTLLNYGEEEEQIKWRCKITQIFIGGVEDFPTFYNKMIEQTGYILEKTEYNQLTDVNKPVSFETIFNKIYVPAETMEYLRDNYFIDILNNEQLCEIDDKGSSIKYKCSFEEVKKLKRLNFVLSEKTALSFMSTDIFKCVGESCECLIEFNSKYEDFIFGIPVFRMYDIVFDYNSRDLLFYGENNKYLINIPVDVETSVLTVIIYILLVVIAILLLGLLVIYLMRAKNSRRKELEEEIYQNF